ncbi:type IV secretory system conjugative DNA transfer family protein [Fibrella sp. HMF5405]|uniref:Type IV secretory system conjugative DNA transfer family protein n=1 Tax=Fibrella forsythiae TaxID=2817061 RepID=A0ABS3JMA6_9BACT|nr:type IV secretory system conjugative DNA transfer family protein [Fibrella forsythiae]
MEENVGEATSYNPLDILADTSSIHLVDDAQMIAEMLVPVERGDKDKFFTDTARSIVTGLIMQIVTTQEADGRILTTLWRWARLAGDDWDELIARMRLNNDPVNGEIVRNAGNEIVKLMQAGEETFGSILSSVLQATDFLKSPALQQSLRSGYDPTSLSNGNTSLYIIIPADKLQSHARWLRLIVTTTLRAVVRKLNKRVTFLLDEFAALGYLPEIETALSTYAEFEVTVWPILQSLIQLKGLYGENWETFTANTAIRQFFTIYDNFTANYVSAAIGQTSHAITTKGMVGGVQDASSNQRPLVTPDEIRRGSAENIFAFLGSNPPTLFVKRPYYQMFELRNKENTNSYYSI